jgi:uncharacterized protein
MQARLDWQGLPYHPISLEYKRLFGEKVYKIPVATAETCPNREGLRGMQTCNFCDVWGSSAFSDFQNLNLREQIEQGRERVRQRVKARKFMVYFQAYTSTFERVKNMRQNFEVACSYDDIVGLVVGTRPDCISDSLFELWDEYSSKTHLAIEYGLQSFDEDQLLWMRRGHSAKRTIEAIQRTAQNPRLSIGVHLIFGLPNETNADIVEAAHKCNRLPIDNVKLHNLHVLKNTPLAEEYAAGAFSPIALPEYTRRVLLFLAHLDPRIAVHRLAAVSARPDELIAPDWVGKRMDIYQHMLDTMKSENQFQGKNYAQA